MDDSSLYASISPGGAAVNKRRRLNQRRRTSNPSAAATPVNQSDNDEEMSSSSSSVSLASSSASLSELIEGRCWEQALARLQLYPHEARTSLNPSPLALSCRLGAPLELVQQLLKVAPEKLRLVLDSRGTPIHEAIVCETVGPNTIQALLNMDETLPITTSSNNKRATLLQDVDGFTPLHLLIRRRFQSHILGIATSAAQAAVDQQQPNDINNDINNDNNNNGNALMQILEMLVRSCPEAVVIPDLGEYEEPPIVYAIKATIYAPALDASQDETLSRVERQIYEMVSCMLRYCPQAAAQVFSGYRGQYSALHSAVFHGRITNTIELLLETEAQYNQSIVTAAAAGAVGAGADSGVQQPAPPKLAALLGNTQGEIPLHFCAMRGERPRTVALIAHAAPQAVLQRDATGLTPLHWLWVRFVSNLLALDGGNGAATAAAADTISLSPVRPPENQVGSSIPPYWKYVDFTNLELGDFDRDLQLIKRMDPPVDFLRMRHIPMDVLGPENSKEWARRSVQVLEDIRSRYIHQQQELQQDDDNDNEADHDRSLAWNRRQVVTSLFWTKVVSLLTAANVAANAAGDMAPRGESILVHSAFCTPSSLPALCFMAASLFPEELTRPDERGRLPIHYAAQRPWHAWDCAGTVSTANNAAAGANETPLAGAKLLQGESFAVLRQAIEMSPPAAFRVKDNNKRLALHEIIDTLVSVAPRAAGATAAGITATTSTENQDINGANNSNNNNNATSAENCPLLQLIHDVVKIYPESLQIPDGRTGLYPFLQATAVGTEQHEQGSQGGHQHQDSSSSSSRSRRCNRRCTCSCCPCQSRDDDLSLSITFQLLRENPTLLSTAVSKNTT